MNSEFTPKGPVAVLLYINEVIVLRFPRMVGYYTAEISGRMLLDSERDVELLAGFVSRFG